MKTIGKKKLIITLVVAIVLIAATVAIGLVASGFICDNRQKQLFGELGKIETAEGNTDGEIAYMGEHITILKDDLERYTRRAELAAQEGEDVSEEALFHIAVREIYYYRGKEAGIEDDNDTFAEWLSQYRSSIERASNYSDFEAMAQGAGMTTEEYWEWAETSPSFRKEYYSTLFVAKLMEDFSKESGVSRDDPDYYEKWTEYHQNYKKQAVEAEHLKPVGTTD